jgi:glycosyltransferase involved in cell wall biosynthesis
LHDFELLSANALDARGGWRDQGETRFAYRLLNTSTFPLRRLVHVPRVAKFVSVSRFQQRIYRARGIDSEVLPNFLPRAPATTPLPTFEEREGIAFVGRLQPEKGVFDVVELAKRLPDVPVTIIGSGVFARYVAEQAARLQNLTATGFLDAAEISKLIRRVRLVAAPYRRQEAGPLSPIEAMSLGTPVIAYGNGGLAEYVTDAGAGRVVPSDPESLVRACAELHDDPKAWSELSRRSLAAVQAAHSRDAYVERIEQIYERVVREPTLH